MSPRAFTPGAVVGEAFPEPFNRPGAVGEAVERLARAGFFRRLEIPGTLVPRELARAGDAARAHGVRLTAWASPAIYAEKINPAAIDEPQRLRALKRLREIGEAAADAGADALGVISGPDPGGPLREKAKGQLLRTLTQLAGALPMRVVLEPLDRSAHKRALIGPVAEAVALVQSARTQAPNVFLCWDSGHALLNGEDPLDSLRQAAPVCAQLHFSNPVLARDDPLFGDHHYPIDGRGAGTAAAFSRLLELAQTLSFPLESRTSLAVEVRTQGGRSPEDTLLHCRDIFCTITGNASP